MTVAVMIVAFCTQPGDTVVSIGFDPALAGAAGAGARDYRFVAALADLVTLGRIGGHVALLVLSWPPGEHRPQDAATTDDMFAACRSLLTRHGTTIVLLAATPTGDQHDEHGAALVAAAQISGLELRHHIITVTDAPSAGGDVLSGDIRQHLLLFSEGGDHDD